MVSNLCLLYCLNYFKKVTFDTNFDYETYEM